MSETNYTIALRRSLNDNFSIDLYISSADGLQDLGQLLNSKKVRKGFRFTFLFVWINNEH